MVGSGAADIAADASAVVTLKCGGCGEEGRGISQILEMGTLTRLDCALGTSGLMRQALSLALNHTAQRQAFAVAAVCAAIYGFFRVIFK